MEPTVNSNLSFLVAEIFVFENYSKIVLLRQENIRIMLAVLLLEKEQKLCSIPQIMPKIMLAQSARAYPVRKRAFEAAVKLSEEARKSLQFFFHAVSVGFFHYLNEPKDLQKKHVEW